MGPHAERAVSTHGAAGEAPSSVSHTFHPANLQLPALTTQGKDTNGEYIRAAMQAHGVDDAFVSVGPQHTSSACHVFVDTAGERSVVMSPGSTAAMTGPMLESLYDAWFQSSHHQDKPPVAFMSSEISQLPLSGVAYLQRMAHQHSLPFAVDVDVPVETAVGTAQLGTLSELAAVLTCVGGPTLVKLSAAACESTLYLAAAVKAVLGRPTYDTVPHAEAVQLLQPMLEAAPLSLHAPFDGRRADFDADLLAPMDGDRVGRELHKAYRAAANGADVEVRGSIGYKARQLVQALSVPMVVVTDGHRGASLAVGDAARTDTATLSNLASHGGSAELDFHSDTSIYGELHCANLPPCEDLGPPRNSSGAGDAFFGGLLAALAVWGMPATAEAVQRVGAVGSAAGAACTELVGAVPDLTPCGQHGQPASLTRMLQLAPGPVEALVRDAQPLSPLLRDADGERTGHASSPDVGVNAAHVQLVHDAVQASLRDDVSSVQGVARLYEGGSSGSAQILRACDALLRCASQGGHVYCSGAGRSAHVAARTAASLRAVGIPATFLHTSAWGQGDAGTLRSTSTLLLFSRSGDCPDLSAALTAADAVGAPTIALCGKVQGSTLHTAAQSVDAPVEFLYVPSEADGQGRIPKRSVLSTNALVNAMLSGLAAAAKGTAVAPTEP